MLKRKVDALTEKLETKYCIPDWLRDENVKISCARFPDRIQLGKELMTEPIALVCFGTSLHKSWEHIKEFKYVMSCSGSHKFLRERGITPTHHVEVDPRSHKIQLIGDDISPDTTFLMASCCHPEVFDHLVKHNAKIVLWHTYSGEKAGILPNVYPRGEWVSTGGANVGLRAMVLCRMLGFKNIHLFGMDGSFEPDGATHADKHPNSPKDYILAEFEGKEYATTTAFLECARGILHELEQLSDVDITFYGKGLVQDMVKSKSKELKKKEKSTIAFYVAPTISKEYIRLNSTLHNTNPTYGVSVLGHIDKIKKIYEVTESKSLLDYGCLSSKTKIETEDGLKTIKWIVDNKYTGKVLSLTSDNNLIWNKIINWWCRKNNLNKKWVKVLVPKSKLRLICTEDHPCASIENILNPVIKYIPAKELVGKFSVRYINKERNTFGIENPLYNKEQISILVGIGIGDGYFDKVGRMYNSHGLKQEEYVYFKKDLLGGEIIRVPPSRTGKSKDDGYFFHCPTNAQTKEFRRLLYPNNKKTPINILPYINEISLAFWYMDDGRLKIINKQPYAEIHTEGFSDTEQIILKNFLKDKWNFDVSIYRERNGNHLHLSKVSSQIFFKMIAPYMHTSMMYKIPESFWGAHRYKFNTTTLNYSAVYIKDVVDKKVQFGLLYDIEVENTHNFIANQTFVHNCGKGLLAKNLEFPIWEYDPAIEGKDSPPRPADLVVCVDVLEHIEPDYLNSVLNDIARCIKKVGYLVINTQPAKKFLADGRNTHLIQQNKDWWIEKLSKIFVIPEKGFRENGSELQVVITPKGGQSIAEKFILEKEMADVH